MKTNLKKLFLLAIVLFIPHVVSAASLCSYSEQAELNNIVGNVKATYEAVDVYLGKTLDIDNGKDVPDEIDDYTRGLKINILNITDDIYVKVTSKNDNKEYTFKYSDTDNGVAEITTTDVEELNTYTIEVFSNKYACVGERYRIFELQTPMYNFYSKLQICADNPNYYYCQEFIPTENVNATYFYENIEKYAQKEDVVTPEEEKTKNFLDKLKEFYENNKLIIYSVGIVIVVAGVATTVILIKKKRSRVL